MAVLHDRKGDGWKRKRQGGAALVEAVIALPVFFALLFGIIEYTYAYRARATLNLASFEAVRAGSLHNASLKAMKTALAQNMAPEYIKGDASAGGLLRANLDARLFQAALDQFGATVSIVSPNAETFRKHRQKMLVRLVGEKEAREVYVIPNDNLYWRDSTAKNVKINGKNEKISLQDANLLKIKTFWCHRLVTPGLDKLVYRTILNPPGFLKNISNEQRACNRLSLAGGVTGNGGYYVAITSQAIMRMQTPVYDEGQLPGSGGTPGSGSGGGTPGSGSGGGTPGGGSGGGTPGSGSGGGTPGGGSGDGTPGGGGLPGLNPDDDAPQCGVDACCEDDDSGEGPLSSPVPWDGDSDGSSSFSPVFPGSGE